MSLSLISGEGWGSGVGVTTATGVGVGVGVGAGVGLAATPATVAGALGDPPPQAASRPNAPRAAQAATLRVMNTLPPCPKHETLSFEHVSVKFIPPFLRNFFARAGGASAADGLSVRLGIAVVVAAFAI